jgi:hypothetical protein
MLTRLVAKVTLTLAAEALLCLAAQSQTTYHFHKETASAGYYLLSTAGPDAASTTLTTSDLKGKTGSTWIANWATAAGVPNSAGTVTALHRSRHHPAVYSYWNLQRWQHCRPHDDRQLEFLFDASCHNYFRRFNDRAGCGNQHNFR